MHILVIGEEFSFEECRQKFGSRHTYTLTDHHRTVQESSDGIDVIFDFAMDRHPEQLKKYQDKLAIPIFINTAKVSLAKLNQSADITPDGYQFGFAGMRTFLNREILEVSVLYSSQRPKLEELCLQLNTPYQIVEDQVGMVTPRVVCMIINEAYYTAEEGTATRTDIDLAMKLGTNYPFGPFEWCQRIGVKDVYELLEAVFDETNDERYTICPLLKKEYQEAIR